MTFVEPLFLSCSEVDHTFDGPSRRRALDILQEGKKTYHYQLFSGVEHGFALRGDPKDPYQRKLNLHVRVNEQNSLTIGISKGWVKEQSLNGIVNWFSYWLSQ